MLLLMKANATANEALLLRSSIATDTVPYDTANKCTGSIQTSCVCVSVFLTDNITHVVNVFAKFSIEKS